ncbi:hypothetical protein BH20ACI3_BH20ACI3_05110 [soil metagenome]
MMILSFLFVGLIIALALYLNSVLDKREEKKIKRPR